MSEACIGASVTLRMVTSPKVQDKRDDWLQIPKVFCIGGGNISLSYSMCMGLMMLGRQKNIQQSH
jgi:hypothetical protein